MQRELVFPCEDGTVRLFIEAEAARLVDEIDLIARCCSCATDRSSKGLVSRIRRNVQAYPQHADVRVFFKIDQKPRHHTTTTATPE